MEQTFIVEFGIILAIAAILGIIARLFKQPLILAYLLAGIIIGPIAFGLIENPQIIKTFAEIGIVFLLFLVGIELNPKKLLEVGNTALVAAFCQIIISGIFYYIIAQGFGYTSSVAIYLSAAFAFSSTAIIITLLSSRKDLDSVHGKIIVGILLIQDFVALLLMTIMSAISSSQADLSIFDFIYKTAFKAIILFGLVYLINRFLLPRIFNKIARSHELLFLSSLAWCFVLALSSLSLGFSAEIGAFLAGITIATLPYSYHIAAKTKPLRDFFIMIFFVYMGSNLIFDDIITTFPQALIFALIILVVNPFVISLAISLMGFRKRTSFIAGITLTQTSEFSFIIVMLGIKLNILPVQTITLASLVAIISIVISTYFISHSSKIYSLLRSRLSFLKTNSKENDLENLPDQELNNHVILIGHHRMGSIVLEALKNNKEKAIVIDFDPGRIKSLMEKNEYCIYGDAVDNDIMDDLNIKKAKMVISTIDKYEESLTVVENYKKINPKIKVIATAQDADEANDLYKAGADLVIVPTLISGDYLSHTINKIQKKDTTLDKMRKRELEEIKQYQLK